MSSGDSHTSEDSNGPVQNVKTEDPIRQEPIDPNETPLKTAAGPSVRKPSLTGAAIFGQSHPNMNREVPRYSNLGSDPLRDGDGGTPGNQEPTAPLYAGDLFQGFAQDPAYRRDCTNFAKDVMRGRYFSPPQSSAAAGRGGAHDDNAHPAPRAPASDHGAGPWPSRPSFPEVHRQVQDLNSDLKDQYIALLKDHYKLQEQRIQQLTFGQSGTPPNLYPPLLTSQEPYGVFMPNVAGPSWNGFVPQAAPVPPQQPMPAPPAQNAYVPPPPAPAAPMPPQASPQASQAPPPTPQAPQPPGQPQFVPPPATPTAPQPNAYVPPNNAYVSPQQAPYLPRTNAYEPPPQGANAPPPPSANAPPNASAPPPRAAAPPPNPQPPPQGSAPPPQQNYNPPPPQPGPYNPPPPQQNSYNPPPPNAQPPPTSNAYQPPPQAAPPPAPNPFSAPPNTNPFTQPPSNAQAPSTSRPSVPPVAAANPTASLTPQLLNLLLSSPTPLPTDTLTGLITAFQDQQKREADSRPTVRLPDCFTKGLRVTPFEGGPREDIRGFLAQYESYCRTTTTPKAAWTVGIEGFLRLSALKWFQALNPADKDDYEKFKAEMIREFGTQQTRDARAELRAMKYVVGKESIAEFAFKLKRQVAIAFPDIDREKLDEYTCWYLVEAAPVEVKMLSASFLNSTNLSEVKNAFAGAVACINEAPKERTRKHVFNVLYRDAERDPQVQRVDPSEDYEDPALTMVNNLMTGRPSLTEAAKAHRENIGQIETGANDNLLQQFRALMQDPTFRSLMNESSANAPDPNGAKFQPRQGVDVPLPQCYKCHDFHSPPFCTYGQGGGIIRRYKGEIAPGVQGNAPNNRYRPPQGQGPYNQSRPQGGQARPQAAPPQKPQANVVIKSDTEEEAVERKLVYLARIRAARKQEAPANGSLTIERSCGKFEGEEEELVVIDLREPPERVSPSGQSRRSTFSNPFGSFSWIQLSFCLFLLMMFWLPLAAGTQVPPSDETNQEVADKPQRDDVIWVPTDKLQRHHEWIKRAKALRGYLSYNETHFGRKQRDIMKELPEKIEETEDESPTPSLSELFRQNPAPGAIVNMNLGAVAIPAGLVLRNANKRYYFNVMDASVPYWMPLKMRHPERIRTECTHMPGALRNFCLNTIDPLVQHQLCPFSHVIEKEYEQAIAEHIQFYDGAVNVDYFREWLQGFCKDEEVKQLDGYMRTQQQSIRTLHDGLIKAELESIRVNEHVARGMGAIYAHVENLRCQQAQGMHNLSVHTDQGQFRAYIRDVLDAITESASTGKLTPRILPANELKALLKEDEKDDRVRASLSSSDPSLVYRFGRVIPVRLHLPTLRFGYVLEVPIPTAGDVMPLYQIQNAGFEVGPRKERHPRQIRTPTRTYRVPLPRYAIYANKQFQGLDMSACHHTPGLALCDVPSVLPKAKGSRCLQVLLDGDTGEDEVDCFSTMEPVASPKETQVIVTVAGLLIRTAKNPPTYLQEQIRSRGTTRVALPPSPRGTYWVRHGSFASLAVGGVSYLSQNQAVHTTRVHPPKPFDLSLMEGEALSPPDVRSLVEVAKHQDIMHALLEDLRKNPPQTLPQIIFAKIGQWWKYITFGLIAFFFSAFMCCGCLRYPSWRRCPGNCARRARQYFRNRPRRRHHSPRRNIRYDTPRDDFSADEEPPSTSQGLLARNQGATVVTRSVSNGSLTATQTIVEYPARREQIEGEGVADLWPPGANFAQLDNASSSSGHESPFAMFSIEERARQPTVRFQAEPSAPPPYDKYLRSPAQSPTRELGSSSVQLRGPRSAGSVMALIGPTPDPSEEEGRLTRSRSRMSTSGHRIVNVAVCNGLQSAVLATQVRRAQASADVDDLRLGFTKGVTLFRGRLMIDPAADVSIMNPDFSEKLGYTRLAVERELEDIDGACATGQVSHKVIAGVYMAGHLLEHTFYIPVDPWQHQLFDALMGTDFLCRLGKVTFDYDHNFCEIIDRGSSTKFKFDLEDRRPILSNKYDHPDRWILARGEVRQFSSSDESTDRSHPVGPPADPVDSDDLPLSQYLARDGRRRKDAAESERDAVQTEVTSQMYRMMMKQRAGETEPVPLEARPLRRNPPRKGREGDAGAAFTPANVASNEARKEAFDLLEASRKAKKKSAEQRREKQEAINKALGIFPGNAPTEDAPAVAETPPTAVAPGTSRRRSQRRSQAQNPRYVMAVLADALAELEVDDGQSEEEDTPDLGSTPEEKSEPEAVDTPPTKSAATSTNPVPAIRPKTAFRN